MVRIELNKTTPLKGNPLHNLVEFVVLKTTLEGKLIISYKFASDEQYCWSKEHEETCEKFCLYSALDDYLKNGYKLYYIEDI